MGTKSVTRFNQGVLVKPTDTNPTDSNPSGLIAYSSTGQIFRGNVSGTFSDFVMADTAQTLTNKSLAASSNTISGLTNTNLSGSAAITNANLATMAASSIKGNNTAGASVPLDLTVSQVNTLLGDVTTIGTYDSQAGVADALSITGNSLFAQSATTGVPGMINTSAQSFAGAKTFASSISASNLSGTNTGDVTLAAAGSVPNASGASLAGQVLTLQPADATNPGLLSAIAQTFGGVKTHAASSIFQAGLAVSGSTSGLVTVTAPSSVTSYSLALPSAQATAAGQVPTNDGSGNLTWTSPLQGTKNYLSALVTSNGSNTGNGNFETGNTSGWSLFNTGLSGVTPTGAVATGATTITTFAATGTSQVAGLYSLRTASTGNISAGQGFISDTFNIDTEDEAKVMTVRFYNQLLSGTGTNFSASSANTFAVYIYDVTNSAWIQPAGVYGLAQNSGVGYCTATFQTTSNSTQYRLAILCINSTTTAANLLWDDFFLGPQTAPLGAAVTDWSAYTPTFVGFGTPTAITFYSRRVGDALEVFGKFTTGTNTATEARITIGYIGANANVTVDTTKVPVGNVVGTIAHATQSATYFGSYVLAPSANQTYVNVSQQTLAANATTVANGDAFSSTTVTEVHFTVPIVGWSSNVQMSSDTDTRVVAAIITGDPASATSGNPIIVPTVVYDSHAGYNSTTGRYTCPIAGIYKIYGALLSASAATTLTIYKNAVSTILAGNLDSNGEATYCGSVQCAAGDIIDIRPGGTVDATSATINIERLSGPATIAASEKVYLQYTNNGGTVITSQVTNVDWTTKVVDSHNAWNGTTFTAPRSDFYIVVGCVQYTAAGTQNGWIYVNAVQKLEVQLAANAAAHTFSGAIYLLAGNTLTIRTNAGTLLNSATEHWISVYSQ